MKIVAVIPAYNEEVTIGDVVKGIRNYVDIVIVVNNNSSNNTREIAKVAGAEVAFCSNRGSGAATSLGIQLALNYNPDVIVTIDGDGQHNPDEIAILLQPFKHNDADIVIGSRFPDKAISVVKRANKKLMYYNDIPKYRRFGINVITLLCNVFSKQKYIDAQSCFRAFTSQVAREIELVEDGFGFSVEFLIKARKRKYRIKEVPISCIYYKDYKQNSTLSPIKHGIIILWAILQWRLVLWC